MPPYIAGLVLVGAVMHAAWNAVVKTGQDRVLTMASVMGVGSVLAAAAIPFVPPPAPASWVFLVLSSLIHIGYFFFLLQGYRVGDLSHVYPVARGSAPLLVALGGMLFAGEHLTARELAGLLLLAVAISSFGFEGARSAWNPRAFLFGLGTAACIGAYTITDGLGVRRSGEPLGFVVWLLVIDGFPLLAYALATRRDRIASYLRVHWKSSLIGGLMCGMAYGVVVWALSVATMAYVSALRETSVIFAALIGAVFLRESFGWRRVCAATLVVAGLVMLRLGGG